jgi:hypothetical protein
MQGGRHVDDVIDVTLEKSVTLLERLYYDVLGRGKRWKHG